MTTTILFALAFSVVLPAAIAAGLWIGKHNGRKFDEF